MERISRGGAMKILFSALFVASVAVGVVLYGCATVYEEICGD
jgi:hypothetical protein